ncbi:molybdopterin-containing oxidoreductase family protein [Sphingobium mellinum]|uniref:molybdopterin-containing oxidoreductase family protein n=1 Tax=Sphingobium mellinum TaxID=1387166 RepID=UPI0030EB4473
MSVALDGQIEKRHSACRYCVGNCGVIVDVDVRTGRAIDLRGDREHPLTKGYACIKGLQGVYALNAPDRILRPLKRNEEGGFDEIPLEQALDEIAARMQVCLAEDGPHSVAVYKGTQGFTHAPLLEIVRRWLESIGSPYMFTTWTIDQSNKFVAAERLGVWGGDAHHMLESEVMMIVGGNPLVSIGMMGITPTNVTKQFKAAKERGMKLIVVDPRRSETAALADLHLQIRPGQDVALFAGLLREVLANGWEDSEFCRAHVIQMDELRDAVEPFTIDMVSERTGLSAEDVRLAARMFAHDARRGGAFSGTGPSMAPHSNLSEHLIQALNVICGRYNREGDVVRGAGLIRPRTFVAQVYPPRRSWQREPKMRATGYGTLNGEMMTAALPDEILTPGAGRVRSLIVVGGNPAAAFPDHVKTLKALKALDLLVTVEPFMTETARFAHYILPPTMQYERWDLLFGQESESMNPEPYQQFLPAVATPPAGSDLIEDWRIFYELAKRLGHELMFCGSPMDMERTPTSEELIEKIIADGPLSLYHLKQHPRGTFVDVPPAVVQPGSGDPSARFEVAPADVVEELGAFRAEPFASTEFPYRLISRRMREMLNTVGQNFPVCRAREPYNPAYFHPQDMAAIGIESGGWVEIASDHGQLQAIAKPDGSIVRGSISMTHCWGGLQEDGRPYTQVGANTNLLISTDRDVEPINAMPRMSAIPVKVRPIDSPE